MVVDVEEAMLLEREQRAKLKQQHHHGHGDEEQSGSCCAGAGYGSLDTPNTVRAYSHFSFGSDNVMHIHNHNNNHETASASSHSESEHVELQLCGGHHVKLPSLRRVALRVSLYFNIFITLAKLYTYITTWSLSVLAALLDSALDVVSQGVLNYTERHSSKQRSSAFYPAGASRLEPIGVLTCAALMGMASFEVLKQSTMSLIYNHSSFYSTGDGDDDGDESISMKSFWSMFAIVVTKIFLLWLCNAGANKRIVIEKTTENTDNGGGGGGGTGRVSDSHRRKRSSSVSSSVPVQKAVVQLADPTLEALAQDHFNDILSNSVAAVALLFALRSPALWFLDPVGAIFISLYIIYSWYMTGKEQIEQLTGKVAPEDFIEELQNLASSFDDRVEVDVVRAYHFGPKFLVEIEVVMPKTTLLFESHDVGMELQYEIESREEVERCFVHIDYENRPYDEHVVSKMPELREKYRPKRQSSARSI